MERSSKTKGKTALIVLVICAALAAIYLFSQSSSDDEPSARTVQEQCEAFSTNSEAHLISFAEKGPLKVTRWTTYRNSQETEVFSDGWTEGDFEFCDGNYMLPSSDTRRTTPEINLELDEPVLAEITSEDGEILRESVNIEVTIEPDLADLPVLIEQFNELAEEDNLAIEDEITPARVILNIAAESALQSVAITGPIRYESSPEDTKTSHDTPRYRSPLVADLYRAGMTADDAARTVLPDVQEGEYEYRFCSVSYTMTTDLDKEIVPQIKQQSPEIFGAVPFSVKTAYRVEGGSNINHISRVDTSQPCGIQSTSSLDSMEPPSDMPPMDKLPIDEIVLY